MRAGAAITVETLLFGFPQAQASVPVFGEHTENLCGAVSSPGCSSELCLVWAPRFHLQRDWNLKPNLTELKRRLERDISQDHGVAEQGMTLS